MDLKDAHEKTTVLQSKLYEAAKADPNRRFYRLYDKLYRMDVVWSAYERVRRNGGSPGVDGVRISDIQTGNVDGYLFDLGDRLRKGEYRPQALRRVEIPKSNGKMRSLGIPTVEDRVVQTAMTLILEPIFEADFLPHSYGFRPGIGQPDALAAIKRNADKGFRFVVDADIEGFFDNVDHEMLMEAVRRRISDGAVLRLIHRWLKAGVMVGFEYEVSDQGTPQGGVISPLLGNIYLHGLDAAFADNKKGFISRLVRYADDLVIQCGRQKDAEVALSWLTERLRLVGLRLNAAKTRIVEDAKEGFDFLGFHHRRVPSNRGHSHCPAYCIRWPSDRSCQKFRDRIKDILSVAGYVHDADEWREARKSLNNYIRGWGQYFRNGQGGHVMAKLDWYTGERVARYLARSQPKGKKRRRRPWQSFVTWLSRRNQLLRLSRSSDWSSNPYRGKANIRWRAV